MARLHHEEQVYRILDQATAAATAAVIALRSVSTLINHLRDHVPHKIMDGDFLFRQIVQLLSIPGELQTCGQNSQNAMTC